MASKLNHLRNLIDVVRTRLRDWLGVGGWVGGGWSFPGFIAIMGTHLVSEMEAN